MPTPRSEPVPVLLEPAGWLDYELIDSGSGRRLERCGNYRLVRPEPQALWRPTLAERDWRPDGVFTPARSAERGNWKRVTAMPEAWPIQYRGLRFYARLTPFRHLGFFPEQAAHWDFCQRRVATVGRPRVLNLFGYTGLATLLLARSGAEVTHVDASKKNLQLARENRDLAGLADASVRWICDDAVKFVRREVRRGQRYDGIILDPPKFGRGPRSERWDLFESLPELVELCGQLFGDSPLFAVLTTYAMRLSAVALYNLLAPIAAERTGAVECGELALRESSGKRLLSVALFARWSPVCSFQ